ncbi:hypothetical protein A2686_04220 [Candidatus Woesebacteria bacterium RIFCSPHIGHO2_01_FULL_38_10]|uniref:N-acetyltransferase domain-containing protein n=1 Tax=Candidatus Woesebacteria bacterium RIFCSPLOWO2_01_FULL_39_10b TaxID=1802517 RepID=A0A1F8B8R2_9BACT|nr:MAG: hypothetical protein A2686_04220 [Candidatus Woesebacteria bacterium RIFCSPHIGHO2_01_FULL_38_10]OGM60320.1 MAG: hypothetical protein A2892_03170 [Candidatus Woesebacteria bacterium RIFCSPLOWO2_01_FULL_39_10b]
MFKEIKIRKAKVSDAEALRNLRLQLVKENPKTYGVVFNTERRKNIQYFIDLIKKHSSFDSGVFLLIKNRKLIAMGLVRRENNNDPTIGYLGSLGGFKKISRKRFRKNTLRV